MRYFEDTRWKRTATDIFKLDINEVFDVLSMKSAVRDETMLVAETGSIPTTKERLSTHFQAF
jgi:hypothetical protein